MASTSSSFKGVSWNTCEKTWQVHIYHNGECIAVGDFQDEVEAAEAYDA